MKKITKRLLCIILSTVMLATTIMSSVVVANASAVTKPGANLSYTFDESTGVFTISGTGDMYDFRDTNLLKNHMTPWADIKEKIKKVIIEEGVTGVGEYSFYNCVNLTEVQLPSTLKEIRGSGVTGGAASSSDTLSYGAFRGCTSLTSITLPEGLETIGDVAFRECTALKQINIPDSVTSLGTGSFVHCTALESVTFGSGIKEIPTECFYECSKLLTINWGENVNTVGPWAFYGTRLNSVEIPEQITSIEGRGFADCYNLKKATIYNVDCKIADLAFNNTQLTNTQDFTVVGHTGSTAETFANEQKYTFVSLDTCEHANKRTVITKAATCEEAGTQSLVCDDCGAVISNTTIDALGHDYVTVSTEDLTEVNGHTIEHQKCNNCNALRDVAVHKEAEDSTTINKKYVWIEGYYTYTNTATCTRAGYETYTCTVDGCTNSLGRATTQTNIVASGGHTVENWQVTKSATCTDAGSRTGTCTTCGETVTEEISATGHDIDTENPTRIEDKTTVDGHIYKYFECKNCGAEEVQTEHTDWISGCYTPTVITEATCVIDGLERDKCDVCGETRTVTLEAVGSHDWVVTSVIEPTCTTQGQTNYECSRCGLTKQDSRTDALGHDYEPVADSCVAATCTTEGTNFFKCSRCSATKQETVAALGHTPDESTLAVSKAATCEETGKRSYTCSTCGETITDEEIPALGHDFVDIETAIDDKPGHVMLTPTCQREGCKTTETSTVKHVEWIEGYYTHTVLTEATCTTGEISTDTCSICGEIKTNNEGEALGHGYKFLRVKTTSVISSDTQSDSSTSDSISSLVDGAGSASGAISSAIGGTGVSDLIDGVNINDLSIPNYSVIYYCQYCSNVTYKTGEELMKMWDRYYYNKETYGRTGNNNSCYMDVTGDGFINAKDYALIVNLNNAYQAEKATSQTE